MPTLTTPPDVHRKLLALARNRKFRPDGYKDKKFQNHPWTGYKCRICGNKHAPQNVCGVCRGRVKLIRGEMESAIVTDLAPDVRIYAEPVIPAEERAE